MSSDLQDLWLQLCLAPVGRSGNSAPEGPSDEATAKTMSASKVLQLSPFGFGDEARVRREQGDSFARLAQSQAFEDFYQFPRWWSPES